MATLGENKGAHGHLSSFAPPRPSPLDQLLFERYSSTLFGGGVKAVGKKGAAGASSLLLYSIIWCRNIRVSPRPVPLTTCFFSAVGPVMPGAIRTACPRYMEHLVASESVGVLKWHIRQVWYSTTFLGRCRRWISLHSKQTGVLRVGLGCITTTKQGM